MKTLDGKARTLAPDMLVIADAERAAAIGGVMGGADSEVSADTTRIVVRERVVQAAIGARDRRSGWGCAPRRRCASSAAPIRPILAVAMARALRLLEIIGAGQAAGRSSMCTRARTSPARWRSTPAITSKRLLGMDVPDDETDRILARPRLRPQTLGSWQAARPEVAVPWAWPDGWQSPYRWRVDMPGPST